MAVVQPQLDLELDEGELVLLLGRRHWVVLLQRGVIFAVVGGLAVGLAIYRALGGTFVVSDVAPEGWLDLVNLAILFVIGALVYLWRAPRKRNPKQKRSLLTDILYVLAIVVLAIVFYFRFQGGRLLYIDPINARGGDTLNVLLIFLAILMFGILIYIVIDWANDFLIVTNTRVIYDDQQFLVRHVQQQMLIDDIQQVNMRADRYREALLGYGTVVIRSFSPRRLVFENASWPKELQDTIMAEVNKVRRQQEPELLRRMIEDQVYGNRSPKPPGPAIHVEERSGPLPWFFHHNPEIKFETETIIWRPFWLFLVLALLRPLGAFALATLALVLLVRLELLPSILATALGLPILLACAFWAFWIYEEHENDLYILTRRDISDVDRKPFGPENRRQAPLGAIQDISYDVGFIESILGYGDVIIETGGAGGGKFTFSHVPDPRGVQATINDYLTDFRKREKEQQFQTALTLLKQYHAMRATHGEVLDRESLNAAVSDRVAEQLAADIPAYVAQEVATQLPRQVRGALRTELWHALRRWRQRP